MSFQGHGQNCTGVRGGGHVGCGVGRGVGVYGRSGSVAMLAIVVGVLLVPVQAGTLGLWVLLVEVVARARLG